MPGLDECLPVDAAPGEPTTMRRPFVLRSAAVLLSVALLAGCPKPEERPPDGSSGIYGTCLLPTEPPGEHGKVPARQPWAGGSVTIQRLNSADSRNLRSPVDEKGAFRMALNPGQYIVGRYEPELLQGKMLSPLIVKVEAGQFTEVVVDYDMLNVRDLPKR